MQKTSDINVIETRVLPSPNQLLAELPKSEAEADFISRARTDIHRIIFTTTVGFSSSSAPARSMTSRPAGTMPAAWPSSPGKSPTAFWS